MDAKTYGPMCEQPAVWCDRPSRCSTQMSEDFLTVNIFAPRCTRSSSRYPVLIWIHGGSFISYTAASAAYDGLTLANKGKIIVVTFNYRLGSFGFLKLPGVSNGNFGFLDQRKALIWVKNNVQYFGGDPKRITLGGESAGAYSILTHQITEDSKHLFHQSILSSMPMIEQTTIADAEAITNSLATNLNCTTATGVEVDCLQSKSGVEISDASMHLSPPSNFLHNFMRFSPYIDNFDIKEAFLDAIKEKRIALNPTIIGTSSFEAVNHLPYYLTDAIHKRYFNITVAQWRPMIAQKLTDRYMQMVWNEQDIRPEISTFFTEAVYACPARYIATQMEEDTKVWTYVFNHPVKDVYQNPPNCQDRPCHTDDLAYIFGHTDLINTYGLNHSDVIDKNDETLSDKIIAYFSAFVRRGNPTFALESRSDVEGGPGC